MLSHMFKYLGVDYALIEIEQNLAITTVTCFLLRTAKVHLLSDFKDMLMDFNISNFIFKYV
jgi:hypothetical protein